MHAYMCSTYQPWWLTTPPPSPSREREEDLATEDMRKDGFVLCDHSSDDSDDGKG